MQLHLRIAVYRGGDFWRECWKSVKENWDLFDGIFVSFNLYDGVEDDIAVMQDIQSDKLHWRRQKEFLSAEAHGRVIDEWLRGFNLKGHIFILCHDDILAREGLLELKALDLKENDAAFCGALFFSEDGGRKPIIIHELSSDTRFYTPPDIFITTWESKSLNVSRCVIPAMAFHPKVMPCHCLEYGCFAELLYLCTPFTQRIYQTNAPAVKVRCHSGSETRATPPDLYLFDNILLRHYIFTTFPQGDVKLKMASDLGYLLREHPLRGGLYWLRGQFRLLSVEHYSPFAGLKVLWFFVLILWEKLTQRNHSSLEESTK
ncbi:MAG: hypothetical protein IKP00_17160 [Victivallales bacterium]|nr:hypothetical protein [Victivallales bacterium]